MSAASRRSESPNVEAVNPSPLVEAVLSLLEDAGMPEAVCDQIATLIEKAEDEKLLDACEDATYRLWNRD